MDVRAEARGDAYRETEATANLLRPIEHVNIPLVYLVMVILIVSLVLIYGLLIEPKSLALGMKYG